MPKLNFIPKRDGFHFRNSFANYPLPFWQTLGRCGGMTAAALDYKLHNLPIPTHTPHHLAPSPVPAEGTRLSQYIYDRLMNTIAHPNASRFILGPWVSDQDCYNWSTQEEFDRIRELISGKGRMLILGFWSKEAGAVGHQVLAYGYELSPMRVYVYDNNHPDEEMRLEPLSPSQGIAEYDEQGNLVTRWRGFFVHDVYDYNNPPKPPYLDIALQSGIAVYTSTKQAHVGDRVECHFTVRNYGDYPAGLKQLFIYVRGPQGETLDHLLGGGDGNATPLQPGEERHIHRVCDQFGQQPGLYTIGAAYLSEQDFSVQIPPLAPGTKTEQQLYLTNPEEALVVDEWREVPESAFDIDTKIDLQPGDDYALSALGEIWAGVWGTGRNGPNGWRNVTTDSKFPLHTGPEAHPFCLIAKIGADQPYFFVGEHKARTRYNGSQTRRLYLRTNDDTPKNGNGVFRCRVQVWRTK